MKSKKQTNPFIKARYAKGNRTNPNRPDRPTDTRPFVSKPFIDELTKVLTATVMEMGTNSVLRGLCMAAANAMVENHIPYEDMVWDTAKCSSVPVVKSKKWDESMDAAFAVRSIFRAAFRSWSKRLDKQTLTNGIKALIQSLCPTPEFSKQVLETLPSCIVSERKYFLKTQVEPN